MAIASDIRIDDPAELDGFAEWLNGGECPWFEIARGVYFNERTQQTFRWRPGKTGILLEPVKK